MSEMGTKQRATRSSSKVRPLSEFSNVSSSSPRDITPSLVEEEYASSSRSADVDAENTLEELQQNLAAFSSSMQEGEEGEVSLSGELSGATAASMEDTIAKLHDQINVILSKVDGLSRQQSLLENVALFSPGQLSLASSSSTDSSASLLSSSVSASATASWTVWVLSMDNEEADEVPISGVIPCSTIYSLKERIKSHPELCFGDIPLSRLRLYNDSDLYLAPRSFVGYVLCFLFGA
jgi:hypothetical protein